MALFKRALSDTEISDIAIRGLIPVINEVFSSYTYTVDPRGLRTRVVEHDGRTVDYAYDNLHRLTQEKITKPNGAVHLIDYEMDDVGNRLSKTVRRWATDGTLIETVVTSYAYDNNDRLLTETTGSDTTTYQYDNNGQTTAKIAPGGTINYSWDFDGRLVRMDSPAESVSYKYDVDGLRVEKSVNYQITAFVVDKNRAYGQVLEERDALGTLISLYVHGDDLISQESAAGVHFYHYDGQMSTRQLTDDSAQLTDTYTYDAFGILLDSTGSTPNNYLYTGEQLDPNLGFYYLRARYMNPENGRFVSMDPFAGLETDPRSLHKYLYAGADPANLRDPSGQWFTIIEMLVALLVIYILYSISPHDDPRRHPAWESDGVERWGAGRLRAYQDFVRQEIHVKASQYFDCTDLALAFLVRFAVENRLRVRLVNPVSQIEYDSDERGGNPAMFEQMIRANFRSSHMDSLTYSIPIEDAGPGDVLIYITPPDHHTRVVWENRSEPEESIFVEGSQPEIVPRFVRFTWTDAISRGHHGAEGRTPRRWNQFR